VWNEETSRLRRRFVVRERRIGVFGDGADFFRSANRYGFRSAGENGNFHDEYAADVTIGRGSRCLKIIFTLARRPPNRVVRAGMSLRI